MRTDQGCGFCDTAFDKFLNDNYIIWQISVPCTPQQNGYIERDNRTVLEMTSCLLHSKDLPTKLWAEPVNTTVYLFNRTINQQLRDITPHEA